MMTQFADVYMRHSALISLGAVISQDVKAQYNAFQLYALFETTRNILT